ncbi:hypothetical protein QBC35DRAFT_392643 [Podospora australis]|uniref:C2H2-type domain-containing protein n=1 Tax=Podospora australis TaxID=1536484 RepID=A0AAN6WL22_9PEZI|nr:hypothetical protein QBC35DRAFT_392643 [Podospora australis]
MAAIPIQAPSRYGPRDAMDSGPLPPLSVRDEGFHRRPFESLSNRIPFNDHLSPSAASGPMAIRGAHEDFAPPPLPPPRLAPHNGPKDPEVLRKEFLREQRMRAEEYGSPESALGLSLSFQKRTLRGQDFHDEAYHSFNSVRSSGFPSFNSQTMRSFRPNGEDFDKSMLNKLNRPAAKRPGFGASLPDPPPQRAHHAQLSTLSLPHRTKEDFLDAGYLRSPADSGYIRSPAAMSATSPNAPFGHHGPLDYRSPLSAADSTDVERSPLPRTQRLLSTQSITDSEGLTPRDYEARDDEDFPMEETSGMRRLNIEDQWKEREHRDSYQPGQKRRASSPPSDEVSVAGDYSRRREAAGLSRGSPTPRLLGSMQGSSVGGISPASRSGSYSSNLTTSSMTFGRRSPNGPSPPGLMTLSDPMIVGSPYGTPLIVGPPRSGIDMGIAAGRSVVSPRRLGEVSKNGPGGLAAKLKGPYMCECCPKKPKKFETEDELRTHEAEKQYECTYCGNRFKNKNEAERHQNSLHVRRHSWSCSALTGYERAFHDSTTSPGEADACGYCGKEFTRNGPGASVTEDDWDRRIKHLQDVHKFRECNASKKFYRADHFRQHLKHSHAGTSGKWTNMLENACMIEEEGVSPGR